MNKNLNLQQMAAMLLALLLVTATGILVLNTINPGALQFSPSLPVGQVRTGDVTGFDYARAADLSAYRWQAMAQYYKDHGLLTRDDFDYVKAANVLAYRCRAMAEFYNDNDMLTRFDTNAAADNLAYRWRAMARYYRDHDMLTREYTASDEAADNMAFRWLAMARYFEKHRLLNER
jgi:hypothetical protein